MAVAALGCLGISTLDAVLDPTFSLLVFDLIPVVYAVWFLGIAEAPAFCGAGLVVPGVQDWLESTRLGEHPLIPYLNLVFNFGIFSLMVWLLALLKGALEHDRQLERERSERELEIARQVQMRLLPAQALSIPGLEIGAAYKAVRTIGGDWPQPCSWPPCWV